jgi:hypothetical protein
VLVGPPLGSLARLVEVVALLDDVRSERPDPVELPGVGVPVREDHRWNVEAAGRERDPLAEVAGRRRDDGPPVPDPPLPCQLAHDQPGPAALERADRVDAVDLDHDRPTGPA